MSNSRAKDTGRFVQQVGGSEVAPSIEQLDLRNSTKPVTNNFQRGEMSGEQGRARPHMPAISQRPDIPWGEGATEG